MTEKYQLNPGLNYFAVRLRGEPDNYVLVVEAMTAIIARERAARALEVEISEVKLCWLSKGILKNG